jgi:hypothetical protein
MKSMFKLAAVAGLTAVVGMFSGTSRAATVLQSGDTYDGWVVTEAPGISLVVDNASGSTLSLEKSAVFQNDNGLLITFTQADADAASTIDINNESITNVSGGSWSGFQFLLANSNASASFTGTTFTNPIGSKAPTVSSSTITYAGSQANFATSMWGFGNSDGLFINTNPLGLGTTFTFKEIPVTGPLVPLPAAVWQGFGALAGLGLVAFGKSLKKVTA